MVKQIALAWCVAIASIYITSMSSAIAASSTEPPKAEKKQLHLPYDPEVKLRRPARNPNFDLNLGLSLQRNDMPQVQRWYSDGADVNALDNRGRSFLYAALYSNRMTQVKFLLQRRANVNVRNKDGTLPMEAAVSRGNLLAINYLFERGASARGKMSRGELTYLQYALTRGQQALAIALIRNGALVDAQYPNGTYLLHRATSYSMSAVVSALLRELAIVDVVDSVGVTPLHEAAAKGYTGIIRSLLNAGADVNARTQKRWTPLHHAARFGHSAATRFLLRQGAKPFATNSEGKNAKQLARQLQHDVVIEILSSRKLSSTKQKRRITTAKKRYKRLRLSRQSRRKNRTKRGTIRIAAKSTPITVSNVAPSVSPPSLVAKTSSHGISDDMIRCVLHSEC